jgi:hypothetical protein
MGINYTIAMGAKGTKEESVDVGVVAEVVAKQLPNDRNDTESDQDENLDEHATDS